MSFVSFGVGGGVGAADGVGLNCSLGVDGVCECEMLPGEGGDAISKGSAAAEACCPGISSPDEFMKDSKLDTLFLK